MRGFAIVGGVLSAMVLVFADAAATEEDPIWDRLTGQLSYAGVRLGFDERGSRTAQLDFDIDLATGTRVLATAGGSSLESGSEALDASEVSIGLSSDPIQPWIGRGEVAWWGNHGEVETESLRFGVTRQFGRGSIDLQLEWRDLRIYTRPLPLPINLPAFFDTDSTGWEIGLRVAPSDHWEIGLRHKKVDYSANVSKLGSSRLAPFVFSPTALGLASGLLESLEGVSATHYFDTVAVTLKWERSESAIDGSRSDLLAVFGELALTSSWDLVLELGGFEGTDGDSVVFGSVSATRSW